MDIYQIFGNDVAIAANGDFAMVDGDTLTQQRIYRMLLTNPGDYIWHPTYGAGLPQYVGQNLSLALKDKIITSIKSQMFLEATVARDPAPVVTLTQNATNISCAIQYKSQASGQIFTLSFNVG